jgi:hypothetical protein
MKIKNVSLFSGEVAAPQVTLLLSAIMATLV